MENIISSPEVKIKNFSKILNDTQNSLNKSVTDLTKLLSETRTLEKKNNQSIRSIIAPQEGRLRKESIAPATPEPQREKQIQEATQQKEKKPQEPKADLTPGALTVAGAGTLLNRRFGNDEDITSIVSSPGAGRFIATSGYGWRQGKMHTGLDIAGPSGTFIALRVESEVVESGYEGGYGNYIDLWCPSIGGGVKLFFGHCNAVFYNRPGIKIPAGKSFATLGSTGRSSGPHIHLEYTKSKNKRTADGPPDAYIGYILLTKNKSSGMATTQPARTNRQNIINQPPSRNVINRNSTSFVPIPQTPQLIPVPQPVAIAPEKQNITLKNTLSLAYQILNG